MSTEAPLEVFWPVQQGRVQGVVFSRDGDSAAVSYGELGDVMRKSHWPEPLALLDRQIALTPEAELEMRVLRLAARQRPPGVEPRPLPWDNEPR